MNRQLRPRGSAAFSTPPSPTTDSDRPRARQVWLIALLCSAAASQTPESERPDKGAKGPFDCQQRGIDFLLTQEKDGAMRIKTQRGEATSVGVTALALAAVLTKPAAQHGERERAFVARVSKQLLASQHADGSFGERTVTYETAAAIHALARLDQKEVGPAMRKARDFLVGAQNTEAQGYTRDDPNYGSFGYGPKSRGDVSNTQFAIEALTRAALETQNDAFAKALVFLQRSQNLKAVNDYRGKTTDRQSNETFTVESGDDGGGVYYPGNSAVGYDDLPGGVRIPRSYGSMTYALLKTYLLCGLPKDDKRVQAAVQWIDKNWSVETNPGAPAAAAEAERYQGLFYYYETMARALHVAGLDEVGSGPQRHAWRTELRAHLEATQRSDGAWLNTRNGRWWEDQPVLCTVFALLALAECDPPPAGRADGAMPAKPSGSAGHGK